MIRKAEYTDNRRALDIYDSARRFMRSRGNAVQWVNGYPRRELIQSDIENGYCFVCEEEDIHGVFAFILGEDPTYTVIENGAWLNDRPYGTIHRIAGDGSGGILRAAVEFGKQRTDYLRIDTHEDNIVMQRAVEKRGFRRCGTIYLADGSPRIAYDLTV